MNFWHILIIFDSGVRLNLGFMAPPSKKDFTEILMDRWRKATAEQQEYSWEWVMLYENIPNEPWLGRVDTPFGSIVCTEKQLIDNR